jgi:hypothetical protein
MKLPGHTRRKALIDSYENLRKEAVCGTGELFHKNSFAVFVSRGMAAWMKAWESLTPPARQPVADFTRPAGIGHRPEIVTVLVSAVLSSFPQKEAGGTFPLENHHAQ